MKHVLYVCQQPCDTRHCFYCDGGLASCTVCNGAEGTLLDECPGYAITSEAQDLIMAGIIKTVADLRPEHRREDP